ncbi:hypothetical protein NLX83_21555 [Allokutzneria sp. A3M-2-11 16]|uniref:hypothetical protein n=1 Tax=Allokutzneria sp. A3M-2-11 16 TaxID=2962043 RepID=UPI0020B7CAAF|nr:hypothetical protein [Allokutzneria sp. A3M-2-11 16]MCP3801856.1 hypothetical protein [Allokutzneria sp. A3M-2-11 16]
MGKGDAAGGSLALAALIDSHGGELIADFQAHYRLDLSDVLRPDSGLTPRRTLLLAEHLPSGSATVAALLGGPEHREWSTLAHLLAALVDATQAGNWQRGGGNGKRPRPITRPRPRRAGARAARAVSRMVTANHRSA